MDKDSSKTPVVILVAVLLIVIVGLKILTSDDTNSSIIDNNKGTKSIPINKEISLDGFNISFLFKSINNGSSIEYEVINNESSDAIYYIDSVFVNKCRVYDEGCYTKPVTGGNKAIDSYDISGVKPYGISEIMEIDIDCSVIMNSKNHEYVAHIEIEGNGEDTFAPQMSSAELTYSDENLDLFTVKLGDGLEDFEYLVHNKSEKWIEVDVLEAAVNGIMAENYGFFVDVMPKGYCYTGATNNMTHTIWSALGDEIKKKGFDKVESISGNLRIFVGNHNEEKIFYEVKKANLYN